MPAHPQPVRTRGLTHIALAVSDPKRSAAFYQRVFGTQTVYEEHEFVQVQTPGSSDVIVFQRDTRSAGKTGGVLHFGFRLVDAADIELAATAVAAAGGQIRRRGEFTPGEPYLYFTDPDGYEVEVWYEPPTPFDPPRANEALQTSS
jgi:catechol 2,3-dioxygenase-like lactoylglutathione lyase family enzyme